MATELARYRQIAEDLTSQIADGTLSPGQTLSPEPELARQYGVTRVTLRKAVDLLVAGGLVKRQQGRGTFVADNRHAAHASYLLYVGQTEEHFYKEFYCALNREAQTHHFAVASFFPHADESPRAAKHWQQLAAKARTVIYDIGMWEPLPSGIPATTPVLAFGRSPLPANKNTACCPAYHIFLDTRAAVRIATEHVLKLGHRRIAFITSGPMPGVHPLLGKPYADLPEYLGFQDALLHAGIAEEFVIGIPGPASEDEWEISYDATLRHFFSTLTDMPTAFVCDADFRAARLLAVMEEHGLRAPDDFSVVGLWNTPWCSITSPPLSSVSFSEEEVARLLVMLSQQPLPSSPVQLSVTPRLVERSSCGPKPEKAQNKPAKTSGPC